MRKTEQRGGIDMRRMNALPLLSQDMDNYKVTIILPNTKTEREMYLLMMQAKVDTAKELKSIYGKEVTTLHLRLITKTLGNGETDNTYGVFFNSELRIVFAFNRLFAGYDSESKQVVYKTLDEIIEAIIDKPVEEELSGFTPAPFRPNVPFWRPNGALDILSRYSIPDPRERGR